MKKSTTIPIIGVCRVGFKVGKQTFSSNSVFIVQDFELKVEIKHILVMLRLGDGNSVLT